MSDVTRAREAFVDALAQMYVSAPGGEDRFAAASALVAALEPQPCDCPEHTTAQCNRGGPKRGRGPAEERKPRSVEGLILACRAEWCRMVQSRVREYDKQDDPIPVSDWPQDSLGREVYELFEEALRAYRAERAEATKELNEARATNNRLNRRCQLAEAAVMEKVGGGPSFGRTLANAGAAIYERERDEARAAHDRLRAEHEALLARVEAARRALTGRDMDHTTIRAARAILEGQ